MPTRKMTKVVRCRGALITLTCIRLAIIPTLSATPIASMITRMTPSGGKLT